MSVRLALIIIVFMMLNGCAGMALFDGYWTAHSALFQYEGTARSVCITGDFNQWASDTHCMRRYKGLWTIRLFLPSGVHRYMLIVDGCRWVADPKALYSEDDGFGRLNSVTVIE